MNKKILEDIPEEECDSTPHSLLGQLKNNELYDDNAYIVQPIIRIRRVSFKNRDDWEIINNNIVVLTIHSSKLSQKERNILYTPDGLLYVLNLYKDGNSSFASIKRKLKQFKKI